MLRTEDKINDSAKVEQKFERNADFYSNTHKVIDMYE